VFSQENWDAYTASVLAERRERCLSAAAAAGGGAGGGGAAAAALSQNTNEEEEEEEGGALLSFFEFVARFETSSVAGTPIGYHGTVRKVLV
jgi:hypothetical protein